jgi:hypothetical protein
VGAVRQPGGHRHHADAHPVGRRLPVLTQGALAAPHGIAVEGTRVITTVLFAVAALTAAFLVVDLARPPLHECAPHGPTRSVLNPPHDPPMGPHR